MRRLFESKQPAPPGSSSSSSTTASASASSPDAAARSSVLMATASSSSSGSGRSHSRSRQPSHKPGGMTFTTNSSILGSTTTTIITSSHSGHSHSAKPSPASASDPAAMAAAAAAEASAVGGSATAPPPVDGKTHKRCSVCGKSFNPLRRRHFCRTCTAVVCSSCSISRKVESTFEGAITVRMCVSCKLSAIASQDDFYDRIFASTAGGGSGGGPPSDGVPGSDRLSVASYASNSNTSTQGGPPPPSVAPATVEPAVQQQAVAQTAPPALRRKSSAVNPRRDSLGSTADERTCPLCNNEACAPLRDYKQVPYPFFLELADPAAKNQFIAAKALENEKERLRSVRTLRAALKASRGHQTLTQLCSMAAIASSSPVALVGLLDKHVYAPVAETGVGSLDKIDRQKSLAAHTCRNGGPLVCSDLARDVRFGGNPWVRDELKAQFYAGIPLTLSNGHTVGAIEVFDLSPRFACMDVVAQLQAVVRGLQRKFDDILAKAPPPADDYERVPRQMAQPVQGAVPPPPPPPPRQQQNGEHHSTPKKSATRANARPPAPPTPPAPPLPPPKKQPAVEVKEAPAPPQPVAKPAAPQPAAAQPPATAPAAAQATKEKEPEPSQGEMERRLMELLSQTTSTQEQLRTQQSTMVTAISSHSKQISELAQQLQRMESTMNTKLGLDEPAEGGADESAGGEPGAPPATAAA